VGGGRREVRLRTSKNGEGRVLPLEDELWDLIERRWTARTIKQEDGTTKMSEFVFHRSSVPVADFRKPWNEAIKAANLQRRIFYDLRRTAARNGKGLLRLDSFLLAARRTPSGGVNARQHEETERREGVAHRAGLEPAPLRLTEAALT
jgi:integrase